MSPNCKNILPARLPCCSYAYLYFLILAFDLPLRSILELFVPRHLDGFELAFVGGSGVAFEVGELGDVFVQVGEANGEGIELGMYFTEQDADVFGVVPSERFRHGEFLECKVSRFQSFKVSNPTKLCAYESFKTLKPSDFETYFLVVLFRNVISIPRWNLDDHLARLRDLHLATETRV